VACSPDDPGARRMSLMEVNPDLLYTPPVTFVCYLLFVIMAVGWVFFFSLR
jgi:hypothetical protein